MLITLQIGLTCEDLVMSVVYYLYQSPFLNYLQIITYSFVLVYACAVS